jgi:ribonuclease D
MSMQNSSAYTLPIGIAPAISREAMASLPIRRYEGRVCVVTTRTELNEALADIQQEQVVGFDTETRPAFKKGERYLPALMQVATAHAVYLFQLRRVDVIPGLADMLSEPRITKAGVAVAHDLKTLKEVFSFVEKSVVDVGVVARRYGLEQTGVRNLAGIFLGCRVTKGARTSNWAATMLTPTQITYAATDAWIGRELYLRFKSLGLVR